MVVPEVTERRETVELAVETKPPVKATIVEVETALEPKAGARSKGKAWSCVVSESVPQMKWPLLSVSIVLQLVRESTVSPLVSTLIPPPKVDVAVPETLKVVVVAFVVVERVAMRSVKVEEAFE